MPEFRLFSFARVPVTMSVWFLLLVCFWGASAHSVLEGITLLGAITFSILVHEFGHAFAAKRYGLRPRITLHGWGGLCAHDSPPSAGSDIFITAAGPGAGLLMAALVAGASVTFLGRMPSSTPGSTLEMILHTLFMVNLVWSLFNLLPLWPLDGGQIFAAVIRGKQPSHKAQSLVHNTGIILGSMATALSFFNNQFYLAIICAFLVWENVNAMRRGPKPAQYGASPTSQGTAFRGQSEWDFKPTPMVSKLLWILGITWIVTFVLVEAAPEAATSLWLALHLEPTATLNSAKLWQPFTYMWLHDIQSLSHIFGNLFGLWILGSIMEKRWGAKDFVRFVLLCGIGAGLFSVLMGFVSASHFDIPIVGISGAIMGLLVALSMTMPDKQLLIFFVQPLKAKWLIWIVLGVDTFVFWTSENPDLAWQTHIGGAITAWFLVTGNWRPGLALDRLRLWRLRRGRRKSKRPDLTVLPGGKDDRYLH